MIYVSFSFFRGVRKKDKQKTFIIIWLFISNPRLAKFACLKIWYKMSDNILKPLRQQRLLLIVRQDWLITTNTSDQSYK